MTDTIGLTLGLVVHPTNIPDQDGLALACRWTKRQFSWLRYLFADGGYQGLIAADNGSAAGLRPETAR